jgi:hypothetical protein
MELVKVEDKIDFTLGLACQNGLRKTITGGEVGI